MPENAEKCGRSQARMAELTDLISKRLALACWTLFFVQLSKSIKEYKTSDSWQSNGSGMVVCSGESTHVWHRLTGFCCHHRIIWDLGIWHLAARFPRCIGTFYWAPPNPSQQMGMDQYLLIPFLVGWISSNPSYFDVNYRGTGFWPIPKWVCPKLGTSWVCSLKKALWDVNL